MASSMWSALEGTGVHFAAATTGAAGSLAAATTDPATLLNNQLASALSTIGDAQYWEESISPNTIRQSLLESDPSNQQHTHVFLRAMKWLLASISKGRDVSDFYPHVVKLVGVVNLQVRKMVYMYLVQYANHDATTRELSLLSINSFQRGLADAEQLIRALALRVLTSIKIADILQIQILAVQKCCKDKSPYVRKCAAAALPKLAPPPKEHDTNKEDDDDDDDDENQQRNILLDIIRDLLNHDESTMVLTSALIAFAELCPDRLDWLHTPFHKICHLLTDMDEWGQVVVIDLLARYCRRYFREPVGWKEGTAERVDRERRVRRTPQGTIAKPPATATAAATNEPSSTTTTTTTTTTTSIKTNVLPTDAPKLPPHPNAGQPRKIKRRVVKKGFYSDEEDESTEEEVYAQHPSGPALSLSSAFRENQVLHHDGGDVNDRNLGDATNIFLDDEDSELANDHRKLLQSAMPLLKSRNAGVVLAVCSLQYYCGVSSIKVRTAMGKALVRIHRDRREIQYVVLRSIQTLAKQCPSAFAPFLHDFFVKALDPPFTKLIKLEVLVSLALEPAAIQAVLKELGSYVRSRGDKQFACASIRAVGRVAEMARIVFDRHAETLSSSSSSSSAAAEDRAEANRIALNCLQGLLTLTQTSDQAVVVGETIQAMQCISRMLRFSNVDDHYHVQSRSVRRILLLLVHTLNCRIKGANDVDHTKDQDEDEEDAEDLSKIGLCLPATANASAIWIVGEYLAPLTDPSASRSVFGMTHEKHPSKLRVEVLRGLMRSFPELEICEKEQALHFASKLLVSSATGNTVEVIEETLLCEQILSMGRVDVSPEVRDQARANSGIIHLSIGLKQDVESLEMPPAVRRNVNLDQARRMFLGLKPPASFLPVEEEFGTASGETGGFRFGTLSSLVGHRARSAYAPLPPWASEDSPDSLREAVAETRQDGTKVGGDGTGIGSGSFYESSTEGDSSSSSSPSSSESSSRDSDESSYSNDSSFDGESSSDSDEKEKAPGTMQQLIPMQQTAQNAFIGHQISPGAENADDESSTSSSSSASSSDAGNGALLGPMFGSDPVGSLIPMSGEKNANSTTKNGSSVSEDLKGLVIAPVAVDAETAPTDPDFERDTGAWIQLVRPELAGGLSVKSRYLRSITKSKQAQLLGLVVDKPTVVCVQLRFENEKKDNAPFRRLRIVQRSSSASSSVIRPLRMVAPPEIAQLKAGERIDCVLGIDFAEASDRDGSMQVRLDIKFGAGNVPVELKPTIGDLLLPCRRSSSDFDTAVARLHGFQRVETSFPLGPNSKASLVENILAFAAFTEVGSRSDDRLRLVGTLPASGDPVYVLVSLNPAAGQGNITVCCDHALVVSSVMNLVKRALSG